MTFKKYIFIVILIIAGIAANAQVFSVSGTVMDSVTKQKLAFVNIIVNDEGTFGTTTDIDGNFSITSKKAIETLTFSYVGYKQSEKWIVRFPLSSASILDIMDRHNERLSSLDSSL